QLRREAEKGKEDEGERQAYLDPELTEPLNLAGRSLRRADLSGSKLWKASFVGTQLQGAHLTGARLQGAVLTGAQLQGADLYGAQLQGADLSGAQLQGADLRGAGFFLAETDNDTDLSRANLRTVQAIPPTSEDQAGLKFAIERDVTDPQ